VKAKSFAEEATMLDKLKVVLCDVKNQKNANRSLEKTITDMQIEREAVGKAHDELARRSQSLENDLQRAEQACKELVAHKERLEGENYAMLQQLEESNKREKRNLQLIQDLEQEIRHTVKNHSEMNLASMRPSGTPTPAHSDRDAMNGISDQARPLPESALSSPAVYPLTCVADVMTSPSDRSCLSVGDSCCKEQASVSEPSLSGIGQKPELCESTTTKPEASSAVQQGSTLSAAGVDNLPTEHLSPPNLPCQDYQDCPEDSEKSHVAFTESPARPNKISDNHLSTCPSSPHATSSTEEIKRICETDNVLTSGGSGASIEPLSPANSISPRNSCTIASAQSTGQPSGASNDVSSRQHDRLGSDATPKPPHPRHSGGSVSGGNQRGAVALSTPNTRWQSWKGPRASSNKAVPKRKAGVAHSATKLSPPASKPKDPPKKVITSSFAKLSLGQIPVQFCAARGDLSREPFNPYVLRLIARWEQTLVVTNTDANRLPRLLREMTKHIPPVDDDDLIGHLMGWLGPTDNLHLSRSGGITNIVNRLAQRETYHRFAKTFTTILKYSLLAVQRYRQGDAQVPRPPTDSQGRPNHAQFDATAARELKFKFHSSDRLMLDACQCLHRLCSDLHLVQAWSGRHLQLYAYLCKTLFVNPPVRSGRLI
jgi:hypothetical protein